MAMSKYADFVGVALLPEQIVEKIQDVTFKDGCTQVFIELNWSLVADYIQWLRIEGWEIELRWTTAPLQNVSNNLVQIFTGDWITTQLVLTQIVCKLLKHTIMLVHSAE